MNEAIIHINGVQLDVGQAATLRVAIGTFITHMRDGGLDKAGEAGKRMAEAYIARGSEIEMLLAELSPC